MTIKNNLSGRYFLFSIIIILLFSVFSCKKKDSPELSEPALPVPVELQTLVVFISGEAYVTENGSEREAEIGDNLSRGSLIKTAENSYLELQIGTTGIIRLEDNTSLAIETIYQLDDDIKISLELVSGTVINKVNRILGTEDFFIKTRTAAFGVRGTEFLVSSDNGNALAAVKKGSVAVSMFPDLLDSIRKPGETDDLYLIYSEAAQQIENAFTSVESGKEIFISRDAAASFESLLVQIEEVINLEKAGTITRDEAARRLIQDSAAAAETAAGTALLVRAAGEANMQKLEITDNMQIIPVPEMDRDVFIQTDPPGAMIYFDGTFTGYGTVSALFRQERVLNIRVENEGYDTFERDIKINEITEYPYIIKLERSEPDKGLVSISAIPQDSEIFINNQGPWKGVFRGSFIHGEKISVTVKRNEYKDATFEVSADSLKSIEQRIVLEPLLIPYVYETGLEKTGYILRAGNEGYAVFETGGKLSFLSQAGDILWVTDQDIAEKPVFSNGKVFALSENILNAIESRTGSIVEGFEIEESLYRKPVLSRGNIFINSGSSVIGINSEQLTIIRKSDVPDIIVSNPSFYGGNILSVTDKGVLQIMGERETPLSSIPVYMGNPEGMAAAVSGDTGFFASLSGVVAAVDLASGQFLWSRNTEAVSAEGKLPEIAVAGDTVFITAGEILSRLDFQGNIIGSAVYGVRAFCKAGESNFYISGNDGRIYYYGSRADIPSAFAELPELHELQEPVTSMIFSDGRLHASTSAGKYIVINTQAFITDISQLQ